MGGVGETFDSNVSGMLIDNSNEDAFVDSLEKLIADSNLRQRMSAAACEYARKHFSPEAPIQAYIELLSGMIHA